MDSIPPPSPPRRLKLSCLTQPLPTCSVGSYTDRQVVQYTADHRRRIELEDEAKVVASDWGTELNHLFQIDRGKTASAAWGTVELNHLFQKDRGKTANVARILSPNPTRRHLALSSN